LVSYGAGVDEVELGLGVHGEAGVATMKMASCKEVVKAMVGRMIDKNNRWQHTHP
jgi:dihydroxyacetone kinase